MWQDDKRPPTGNADGRERQHADDEMRTLRHKTPNVSGRQRDGKLSSSEQKTRSNAAFTYAAKCRRVVEDHFDADT